MRLINGLRSLFLLLLTQCVAAPEAAGQFTEAEFEEMARKMSRGKVPEISIGELQAEMQEVILLDTREKAEYDISHIPGAIWVGYDDFDLERVTGIDKKAPVVTYCSVGYRSERIGEKLLEAGFREVRNLHGSLFRWVNEEKEVVDNEGTPTKRVHGYNATWSKWLKRGEIVY